MHHTARYIKSRTSGRRRCSALHGGARAQGPTPSLADLEVYGVLQAVRGMDAFAELQEQKPALAAWYGRMGEHISGIRIQQVLQFPYARYGRMGEHVAPGRLPTDGVAYVDPRAPY